MYGFESKVREEEKRWMDEQTFHRRAGVTQEAWSSSPSHRKKRGWGEEEEKQGARLS